VIGSFIIGKVVRVLKVVVNTSAHHLSKLFFCIMAFFFFIVGLTNLFVSAANIVVSHA
jgi:hypothetical protein